MELSAIGLGLSLSTVCVRRSLHIMAFPGASHDRVVPERDLLEYVSTDDGDVVSFNFVQGRDPGCDVIVFCHSEDECMWKTLSDSGERFPGGDSPAVLFSEILSESSGYSVVAFDYPGYGTSTGFPSVKGCARAGVAALRATIEDRIGTPKVHIVGQGVGCAVACEMCSMLKTDRLVLVAPFGDELSRSGIAPSVNIPVCVADVRRHLEKLDPSSSYKSLWVVGEGLGPPSIPSDGKGGLELLVRSLPAFSFVRERVRHHRYGARNPAPEPS